MIDMHSHIVYEVDDGSDSFDESIEMIKKACMRGVRGIFATPHYMPGMKAERDKVAEKLNKIRQRLDLEGITIPIYDGHELYIDYDTLQDFYQGKVMTLNHSRYLLIELPMVTPLVELDNILYDLLLKGYVPIIAHPERYAYVQKNSRLAEEWIKKGALLQLNLSTLYGKYGDDAKKTAYKMLKQHMFHFVGTDVHAARSASLTIASPLNQVNQIVGDDIYNQMVFDNPRRVVEDKTIDPFLIQANKFSLLEMIKNRIG